MKTMARAFGGRCPAPASSMVVLEVHRVLLPSLSEMRIWGLALVSSSNEELRMFSSYVEIR